MRDTTPLPLYLRVTAPRWMRLLCGFTGASIATTMGRGAGAEPRIFRQYRRQVESTLHKEIAGQVHVAHPGLAGHMPQAIPPPFLLPHRVPERTRPPALAVALHTTMPPRQRRQQPPAECVPRSRIT